MSHVTKPEARPPMASGAISRAALKLAHAKGVDTGPLLRAAGLSTEQMDKSDARIPAFRQVKLLNLVAERLDDELLGLHLAARYEPREAGLFYFVLASCGTLREALRRLGRYTCVVNNAVRLTIAEERGIGVKCAYLGLSRYADRHQMEFTLTIVSRMLSQISGARIRPLEMMLSHPAYADRKAAEAIVGCKIVYAASADEVVFDKSIGDRALIAADPYLDKLLVGFCEAALAQQARPAVGLKTRVENKIAVLLPHGKAQIRDVAQMLGMSERSLSRQLAAENLCFSSILNELRANLAKYHLRRSKMSMTEIAWLLGFKDSTSFSHAFRRWSGKPPSAFRKLPEADPLIAAAETVMG